MSSVGDRKRNSILKTERNEALCTLFKLVHHVDVGNLQLGHCPGAV